MAKSFKELSDQAKQVASKVSGDAKSLKDKVGKVTLEKREMASSGMKVASTKLNEASTAIAEGSRKSFASAKTAAQATKDKISDGYDVAVRSASTVANTAFDQNGDGVFDQEDLKLLTKKGLDVGKAVAKEAGNMAKQASQSALVQDVAAAAAVGAVLGTMIPLVLSLIHI